MGKRPRITKKTLDNNTLVDPMEYKKNKSTDKARQVVKIQEHLYYDLWFDQHYIGRSQLGDESGKRDGISPETIEDLIRKSLHHMVYYSARIKGFSFLNHDDTSSVRIVLQDSYSDINILNVAIEVHFLDGRTFEITVKTAMCVDDYRIQVGQFVIEFIDEHSSVLKKLGISA